MSHLTDPSEKRVSMRKEQEKRTKILVLGLGNELYGDDGVGIHVVRRAKPILEKDPSFIEKGCSLVFEECSLSGLALLDIITGYDVLVIVDTIKSDKPEHGKIRILRGQDLRHVPGPSPHYVSIPQTIEIGRSLGLRVPSRIAVIAVEAKNMYTLGESLTREMESAIPEIIAELQSLLSRIQIK
jgi:hydrogenase maturation protease